MGNLSFSKHERLKSKKKLSELFKNGQTIFKFPIKIYYLVEDNCSESLGLTVAFSVPKRNFKKAVDRNRIKRQMKEAYRLHRIQLRDNLHQQHKNINVLFVYISKQKETYQRIEKSFKSLFLDLYD